MIQLLGYSQDLQRVGLSCFSKTDSLNFESHYGTKHFLTTMKYLCVAGCVFNFHLRGCFLPDVLVRLNFDDTSLFCRRQLPESEHSALTWNPEVSPPILTVKINQRSYILISR